jgi:hypothetical protein
MADPRTRKARFQELRRRRRSPWQVSFGKPDAFTARRNSFENGKRCLFG